MSEYATGKCETNDKYREEWQKSDERYQKYLIEEKESDEKDQISKVDEKKWLKI